MFPEMGVLRGQAVGNVRSVAHPLHCHTLEFSVSQSENTGGIQQKSKTGLLHPVSNEISFVSPKALPAGWRALPPPRYRDLKRTQHF